MDNRIISLCIPTNGIVEWISPVIDSIYNQEVPLSCFEVVIVDNGNNPDFFNYIHDKMKEFSNIRYKRIKCSIFMNEIEAYKMAKGDFIKFVNHRTTLLDGTLNKWINFMEENYNSKPVVYFSNGVVDKLYKNFEYDTFDGFIENLSYWSSWSTGMAIWREDLEDLSEKDINELFPHTGILFKNRKDRKYLIDNHIYLQEVPHTSKNKGRYDLFYAFAVEYPFLLLELYRKKDISMATFLKVKEQTLDFITEIYRTFCIDKQECSYELDSYDDSIEVFYSHAMMKDRVKDQRKVFLDELERRRNTIANSSRAKVLFGAGIVGRSYITENGAENVICFVDKSQYQQGKMVLGIPVISYEDFYKKNIEAELIICIKKSHFYNEEKRLRDEGKEYHYWYYN